MTQVDEETTTRAPLAPGSASQQQLTLLQPRNQMTDIHLKHQSSSIWTHHTASMPGDNGGYGPKGLVAGHKDANLANGPKPKRLSRARRITGCTGHLTGVWLNPQEVLVDWSCLRDDVETGGGPW
jgi:hypothetical protein